MEGGKCVMNYKSAGADIGGGHGKKLAVSLNIESRLLMECIEIL